MTAALLLLFLVLSVGLVAAAALIYAGLWRGLADQWKRFPAADRRRGLIAAGVMFVLLVSEIAVSIAEPWGPDTFLYIAGIGGGAVMAVSSASVAVLAVRDTRRARENRSR